VRFTLSLASGPLISYPLMLTSTRLEAGVPAIGRPNKRRASSARTKAMRDEAIGRATQKLAEEEGFASCQQAAKELGERFLRDGWGSMSAFAPHLLAWVDGRVASLSEAIRGTERNNQRKRPRPDDQEGADDEEQEEEDGEAP